VRRRAKEQRVFFPVGLDENRLGRIPWVSVAIVALNVAAFAATSLSSADRRAEERLREVVQFWVAHPDLELPAEVDRRLHLSRQRLALLTHVPGESPPRWKSTAAEQAQLDELCDDLVTALDASPERRFGLVPARGLSQPGWLTHMFLHGGLGHLLGNMLIFALVVGPFLEDAWGWPFFLGLYLVGGVAAGAAQALPMGDSQTPIIGASGAISALLGAFALRLAHRRVRIAYWFAFFFRGAFFVPAWAFAFFGFAMDLVGLKLSGASGGVAYGAHVGGFFFGLLVAMVVRATGFEGRIAPEDSPRWGRTAAASRASDALAAGRKDEALRHFEEAVARDATDRDSLLQVARLHASRFDRFGATDAVARLIRMSPAAQDAAAVRAALREIGPLLDPERLPPAVAYRAAELVADEQPDLADRLAEVAAQGGGDLAVKALLRAAERVRRRDAPRARGLAERALSVEGASQELHARASAMLRELTSSEVATPATPRSAPRATTPDPKLAPESPVRLLHCRIVGATAEGLQLVTEDGRRAGLAPSLVASLAAGVVREHQLGERRLTNVLLLDLLLRPRPSDPSRVVLRIPGPDMALGEVHPGLTPRAAYARLVDDLLVASGASALPSPNGAAGRPFSAYADAAAFEQASWGRRLVA
jgi:membrane associated rhomboid family serine protease